MRLLVPARDLTVGQVVRVANELFAVAGVYRDRISDDDVHVALQSTRGGQIVISRGKGEPVEVVES